jgi:hypothetical protein
MEVVVPEVGKFYRHIDSGERVQVELIEGLSTYIVAPDRDYSLNRRAVIDTEDFDWCYEPV